MTYTKHGLYNNWAIDDLDIPHISKGILRKICIEK